MKRRAEEDLVARTQQEAAAAAVAAAQEAEVQTRTNQHVLKTREGCADAKAFALKCVDEGLLDRSSPLSRDIALEFEMLEVCTFNLQSRLDHC